MPDPWSLPAAVQFLAEVEPLVRQGGAWVVQDVSTPAGIVGAMRHVLRHDFVLHELDCEPEALPLAQVAEAFGQPGASLQDIGAQDAVLIVSGHALSKKDESRWSDFLAGFLASRSDAAVLFLSASLPPGKVPTLAWTMRLRWADAMIWAEYAVPSGRGGLVQRLAVELAVELCGWRLDLVADLVSQREEDIVDPMGWLSRNLDSASPQVATFGHEVFSCPLQLMAQGEVNELRRRIWSAHLSVLFPWIEDHRQRLIERYRKTLRVDQHLHSLGVASVEDIEMGALHWQLSRVLQGQELYGVEALARMRNDLAHRKPVRMADLEQAMRLR